METSAHLILRTLERHLAGPAHLRLFGGAALILGYGATRFTEDADCLLDDRELQLLLDEADFARALELTNQELAPRALYISHIFGPEQEILTPQWRTACRPVPEFAGRLTVSVLGPLDLILSKLGRADAQDLQDIDHVIRTERIAAADVRDAIRRARVPDILREFFDAAVPRLDALLGK